MSNAKKLRITLVKSINSASHYQKECVKGLGLRKINHEVLLEDNMSVRGLIAKITYMLKIEEV